MIEVLEGRAARTVAPYLSLTHLPRNVLDFGMKEWLPKNISNYKYGGFDMHTFLGDLSENAVETAPACHFWNGGLVIDGDCRTTVEGLWAAGEGTGRHPRLQPALWATRSTMTQVFGPRAGRSAAQAAKATAHGRSTRSRSPGSATRSTGSSVAPAKNPINLRTRLARRLAHLTRGRCEMTRTTITAVLDQVTAMRKEWEELGRGRPYGASDNQEWIECIQIENMLQCLEMGAGAPVASGRRAVARRTAETSLTPTTAASCKNIVIVNADGQPTYDVRPVNVTSLTPPSDVRRYGLKPSPRSNRTVPRSVKDG